MRGKNRWDPGPRIFVPRFILMATVIMLQVQWNAKMHVQMPTKKTSIKNKWPLKSSKSSSILATGSRSTHCTSSSSSSLLSSEASLPCSKVCKKMSCEQSKIIVYICRYGP